MGTTRQQTIADRIYAERQENEAARAEYRRTGNTARINASDRRMGKLANDMNMSGSNLDSQFYD